MSRNDNTVNADVDALEEFSALADWGTLDRASLDEAASFAQARGVDLEKLLQAEYGVPKRALLEALAGHYGCPYIEYDERLPIPPELLAGLDADSLSIYQWMPVIKYQGGCVVIAARNPEDPAMRAEVEKYVKAERYEFWVSLDSDIQWYIQEFLHARPGLLIGTERTGLAYWRNTMARWRTRLARYRTDLAAGRTALAFSRWGLGTVAISNTLLQSKDVSSSPYLYFSVLITGILITFYGLPRYLDVRKSRMSPPGNQTLVEVTAATISFLEN